MNSFASKSMIKNTRKNEFSFAFKIKLQTETLSSKMSYNKKKNLLRNHKEKLNCFFFVEKIKAKQMKKETFSLFHYRKQIDIKIVEMNSTLYFAGLKKLFAS